MDIMNLIHDICLTKIKINNTPKWRIISRNKLIKKLNDDIFKFKNLDIFSASENIITFLISSGKGITNKISGYLWYDDTCMCIEISDNQINIRIEFYPKSNRFEIKSDCVTYSIYRNTKICNYINNMWQPLTLKIKERYLDIIIQIAELLYI